MLCDSLITNTESSISTIILGEGSFGQVIDVDGVAVKQFRHTHHIVQEYVCLKYMQSPTTIVNVIDVDFENLTISMEKWDCSLSKYTSTNANISMNKKIKIFHDILSAVSHLHEKKLLHSDIKPSNILINVDDNDNISACLCDLGLSSLKHHARINQTAKTYRHNNVNLVNGYMHDLYSLVLTFYFLFSNTRTKGGEYSKLIIRRLIRKNISNNSIKNALLSMIPHNISQTASPHYVLQTLFNTSCHFDNEIINYPQNSIIDDILYRNIERLTSYYRQKYNINKMKRVNNILCYCFDKYIDLRYVLENKILFIQVHKLVVAIVLIMFRRSDNKPIMNLVNRLCESIPNFNFWLNYFLSKNDVITLLMEY